MKQSTFDLHKLKGQRLLILSDGKPGHVNQSIALAKHLNCDYDVVIVRYNFPGAKGLSYCLDRMHLYCNALFRADYKNVPYAAVVSAGSATYYANRTLAKLIGCWSIAVMFPRGYRLDFDLIIAQNHDHPPTRTNILKLPVNLSYSRPEGFVLPKAGERYMSFIVGGDSSHGQLLPDRLKKQIDLILKQFPQHKMWLTTSRRTSPEVESMLSSYQYDYAVFYSREQINPIPDFLEHSDIVFITADSSSMISEALANGQAAVEVLPVSDSFSPVGKFKDMLDPLIIEGYVHLFDGRVEQRSAKKINLKDYLLS